MLVESGTHLEGRPADEELVGEHAKRPQVDLGVVLLPLDHLWGEVVERAAERSPPVSGRVYAPPKVADLELALETCLSAPDHLLFTHQ